MVWQRLVFALLMAPFVLAGGTAGAYYLRLHRLAGAASPGRLPAVPAPTGERRFLVLAPHCDDETLGVGGLIADARRAGARVSVAFLTNGDGFPLATGRALSEVRLRPDDYVRFADERQSEALAALGELDVAPDRVQFLGYPDRGLSALWEDHWDASAPFRSPYTRRTASPYARCFSQKTRYCGSSLLADLVRLLRATRPTDIYVTHPSDDHPDHAAAAVFAQAALQACQSESWGRSARLRYYLIHRGDWPLPQGLHANRPLLPPPGLTARDTRWEAHNVSPAAQAAKARALNRYASQMAVSRRFLCSFLRDSELYGALPERKSGVALDGLRDDVVRDIGAAADLSGVSVRAEAAGLRVRVMTRGPVSPRVRYRVRLRGLAAGAAAARTGFVALNLPVTTRTGPGRAANALEATVPWRTLGLDKAAAKQRSCLVWVAAETRWAKMPVDKTGYRCFRLYGEARRKKQK